MRDFIRNFFVVLIVLLLTTSYSSSAKKEEKKDCVYCNKYEKLKDWPENERPEAFIYEKIDYPEGMFLPTSDTPKKKQGEAGGKVYARFVKKKWSFKQVTTFNDKTNGLL